MSCERIQRDERYDLTVGWSVVRAFLEFLAGAFAVYVSLLVYLSVKE